MRTRRLTIAYNAALQAATAALAAPGHGAARESHHHRMIELFEPTIQDDSKIDATIRCVSEEPKSVGS
jgi:hypothetical protein